MKRFYKEAAAAPVEGGFGVTLDGKPVRTPAGAILTAATPALAEALAAEWAEQTGEVRPLAMPLNRLALTQQDRVGPRREAVTIEALAYVESDLLCYRSGDDATLAARQIIAWNPLLDWFAAAYGVTLAITEGLMPVAQDTAALAPLRAKLDGFSDAELTAFALLAPAAGSFVLALALLDGRLSAEEAYALSQLDESYQIEKWGEDEEAAERRAALALEFQDIGRFLALNRG
ncbi:MAG: ATP12 family chaperone protein [Elstera sp.]